MDYFLRKTVEGHKQSNRQTSPDVITHLDFANEIFLISKILDQVQELLERVETSVGIKALTQDECWLNLIHG